MFDVKSYRENEGLKAEPFLTAIETKIPAADFSQRCNAVADMPNGPEKTAAALSLYAESQALPIKGGRTIDPVTPEEIIKWCPILQSPFQYGLTDEQKNALENADSNLRGLSAYALASRYIKLHGFATPETVLTFLSEHPDELTNAQKIAVLNAQDGKTAYETGSFSNPFRADSDALAIGAAFGVAFAPQPEIAAENAMKYTLVSHHKGGVYAAMWMAAMIAHASTISDPEVFTVRSLSCLPIPTVWFRAVSWMQRNLNCKVNADDCAKDLIRVCGHAGLTSDEGAKSDPTPDSILLDFINNSAFSNAMAVAGALLYSEGDPEKARENVNLFGCDTTLTRPLVQAVAAMMK
ncbi:MAG TPA: ADP-ribosylglycohydrolase family protein [Oscillospiraceae bacterium]|nr:ADP-ribosylglycohydrolase family protein [Oscillospiraceae bacterium]HPF55279.1 ADP-ribosylglycohydrolase family protein [Clostridiales bacterium]HPK34683.1 ADP-ribosylglycohydrolase family protein [Oscillospiraceae bacterium]HPR74553.1 ADP-ribosylglycohydrolase family protein [Oscillospiraceae bacterium]